MSDELFVEVLYPFPSVCEGMNIVEKPIIFSSCTLGKGRFVVWLRLELLLDPRSRGYASPYGFDSAAYAATLRMTQRFKSIQATSTDVRAWGIYPSRRIGYISA